MIPSGFEIPFLIAGAMQKNEINKTRIVEAVITALVSGCVIAIAGKYIALPILEERVSQIKVEVVELKADLRQAVNENKQYQAERRSIRDSQQIQHDTRLRQIEIELAKRR